ncbi:MAG: peptide chain release factor 1 [Chloroflexi bacterium]|nr:peptide chain release factor 1 [Chloroflexota bacterium]
MLKRLELLEKRYEELNGLMSDPQVATDHVRISALAKEQSDLEETVQAYRRFLAVGNEIEDTEELLRSGLDAEMQELANDELTALLAQRDELEDRLRQLLLPKDPNDERNVIVEVRAGTGGDEAGLFAADLYRMYTRFAERNGWKYEVLSTNETGIGGFKEIIFTVKGKGAYSQLKFESGVHRVQRVPLTEASGRIHTSTATVAVLPEVDDVDVQISPEDLRIDVFRAQGHGGQGVNTTDSAVRITHLPTGLVVSCQDERSQLQNRIRALSILRARLYDAELRRQHEAVEEARRSQVGSGERSEKIRTYNFPQNRVTDHRSGLTMYQLETTLDGDLQPYIDEMHASEQARKLELLSETVAGG